MFQFIIIFHCLYLNTWEYKVIIVCGYISAFLWYNFKSCKNP